MINNDRIVPIQKIDFLSLIGTVLALGGVDYEVLQTSSIDGEFNVNEIGSAGALLANQPVQTLDFAEGMTDGTVYFVAAYGFTGFTINNVAVTTEGTVQPDGITLYKAVLADGAVTVTPVTPVLSAAD